MFIWPTSIIANKHWRKRRLTRGNGRLNIATSNLPSLCFSAFNHLLIRYSISVLLIGLKNKFHAIFKHKLANLQQTWDSTQAWSGHRCRFIAILVISQKWQRFNITTALSWSNKHRWKRDRTFLSNRFIMSTPSTPATVLILYNYLTKSWQYRFHSL